MYIFLLLGLLLGFYLGAAAAIFVLTYAATCEFEMAAVPAIFWPLIPFMLLFERLRHER